ncbi:hypothetical protein BB560_003036 [Smittium megazygosporum]|uniref:AMP-dependent synthetase/ligase domain-containing protein n=1 Tax=Smittium megazygosporum TaxID=133381 RepID=A0A2T9ZD88_9FUNG|nr:hypothetical protein BB560_003036 [Smittium megazygosporum]
MYFKSKFPDHDIPAVDVATFIIDEGKKHARLQGKPYNFALLDEETQQQVDIFEFEKLSEKLASGLVNKLKMSIDDVALIFSSNSLYYTVSIFATVMTGGIMALANPSFKPRELVVQVRDTNPKIIFTKLELVPVVKQAMGLANINIPDKSIIILDHNFSDSSRFTPMVELLSTLPFTRFTISDIETAKRKVAFLPASSGTTGSPKSVILSHYNIVANTIQISVPSRINGWFDSQPGQGVGIVSLPKFEIEQYLATLEKYKINFAHMVPPMIVRLDNPITDKYNLKSLKYIMTAASQLSSEVASRIRKKFGIEFTQIYGATETSPCVTISDNESDLSNSKGIITMNVKAKIIDDNGNLLGPNKLGELCFKGPNVMNGYLGNPKATKETIDSDGFLHTGDIGYINDSGQLYLVDRKKELIKYKGFQVPPSELESVLLGHSDIFEAIVIGVDLPEQQTEIPKAYISLKPHLGKLSEEQKFQKIGEIIRWFDGLVAPYKRLRGGIVIVEEIPKTLSGKLLRRYIREIEAKSKAKL